jgi:hypothetical protein
VGWQDAPLASPTGPKPAWASAPLATQSKAPGGGSVPEDPRFSGDGFLSKVGNFLSRAGDMADRGADSLVSGLERTGQAAANAITGTLYPDVPNPVADYLGADAAHNEQQARVPVSGSTPWEAVKADPSLANIGSYVGEQAAGATPSLAAAAVALPAFAASQLGNVAEQRAQNNGATAPTVMDLLKAAPSAAVDTALMRGGLSGIINGGIGKAALREGLAMGGMPVADYAGETVGTNKGFDPAEAIDRAAAGVVAGVPFGASMHLGVRGTRALRELYATKGVDTAGMSDEALTEGSLNGAIHPEVGPADVDNILQQYGSSAAHFSTPEKAAAAAGRAKAKEPPAGNLPQDIVSFFKAKGYSDHTARGIAAGVSAEANGGDHTAVNPTSGAFGIGQWLGSRKQALFDRYGTNPTRQQQLEFLHEELQGGDPGGRFVLAAKDDAGAFDAYIRKFMRPAAGKETEGDLQRGMDALGERSDKVYRAPGPRDDPFHSESSFERTDAPESPTNAQREAGAPYENTATGDSSRPFPEETDSPEGQPGYWEKRAEMHAEDLRKEWEASRQQPPPASEDPAAKYGANNYGQRPHRPSDDSPFATTSEGHIADVNGKPVAFRNVKDAARFAAKNKLGGDFEPKVWATNSARVVLTKRPGSDYGTRTAGPAEPPAGRSTDEAQRMIPDWQKAPLDGGNEPPAGEEGRPAVGQPETAKTAPRPVSGAPDAPLHGERGSVSDLNVPRGAENVPAPEPVAPARQTNSIGEARRAAREFAGKPLSNPHIGVDATVSGNTIGKMTSASAVGKSSSASDHALAVANLDQLYPVAREVSRGPDTKGEPSVRSIIRASAPMRTPDGRYVSVKMLVKETAHENNPNPLYTVSVEKVGPASVPDEPASAPDQSRNVAPAGPDAHVADETAPAKTAPVESHPTEGQEPAENGHSSPVEQAENAEKPASRIAPPHEGGEGEHHNQNATDEPSDNIRPDERTDYGADNKGVTKEGAEKARATLRSKRNQLNSGVDPEALAAGAKLGAYHAEATARRIGEMLLEPDADPAEAIKAARDLLKDPKKTAGSLLKGLDRFGADWTYSSDGALRTLARHYGAPTIAKLADMFQARRGTDDATDRVYDEAIARKIGLFINDRLHGPLDPFVGNKAAMERIRDMLAEPDRTVRATDKERAVAGQIRDLLKDVIAYRKEAGEDIGEVKNYFPRVIDALAVAKTPSKFRAAAEKLYASVGADDPVSAAEAWMTRVLDTHAGLDGGEEFVQGGSKPSSSKSREFDAKADTLLRDFYQKDPLLVLHDYIMGSIRRAEQARRFGPKGAFDSKERGAWVKEHGTKTQWDVMLDQLRDELRNSGKDANGVVNQVANIKDTNLGRLSGRDVKRSAAVAKMHAWNQLAHLERVTLSSLGDAPMGFVRFGPKIGVAHLAGTFKEAALLIKTLGKRDPSDARRWAEAFGVVGHSNASALIQARMDMTPDMVQHTGLLNKFYHKIGIEQWTQGGRTMAAQDAKVFLGTLSDDLLSGSARTRQRATFFLKEAGVKNPQAFGEWLRNGGATPEALAADRGHAADYATAVIRMANDTVLMPSRAHKPSWANHPLGSLIFALQSYNAAFTQNVLKRVGRLGVESVKRKDPMLVAPALAGLAVYTATQALQDYLRTEIFGGKPDKPDSDLAYALRIADRASFTGMMSPIFNAFGGLRYHRSTGQALQGSILGSGVQGADAIGGLFLQNSPNTNTAERKVAGLVYDLGVNPAENAFGAKYLKGAAGTAAILGTGNKKGGLLPADRDAFIDAVAGEKSGGG